MITIEDKNTGLTHTAQNWGEFTRMMFNIAMAQAGWQAENLVFVIGRTIDAIITGDASQVLIMEDIFAVQLDWDNLDPM